MNLYLGLGTAEMSVVLSLQSLSMECHVNSSSLSHSLSVVCGVQCAGRVSLKALCPSFPDLRVSGGGMGLWGDTVSLPPSSPLLWWCSAQVPWALYPYLSPQEEYLLGIPLKSGCWHCCFSVPKAHEYLWCVHEPRKYLQMNNQIKPGGCSAETVGVQFTGLQVLCLSRLETKERSQSWQRSQRFNRWGDFHVWSKRILERHPLWIAGDRQKTAAAAFVTRGGWKSTSYSGDEQQVGSLVELVTMETSGASHPSPSPSG